MSCCNIGFWTNTNRCPPSNGCWIQDSAGEFIFVPRGVPPEWECPNFGQYRVVACGGCASPCELGFGGYYDRLQYGGPYYGGAFPAAKGGCCLPHDVTITPGVCAACPVPAPAQIGTHY